MPPDSASVPAFHRDALAVLPFLQAEVLQHWQMLLTAAQFTLEGAQSIRSAYPPPTWPTCSPSSTPNSMTSRRLVASCAV